MRRLGRTLVVATVIIAGSAVPAAAKPDLSVKALGEPPAAVAPGASVSVPIVVQNRGKAKARRSTAGFFLSADARFDAKDVVLGRPLAVPRLGKGKSDTGIGSPTVPAATAPGTYRLIACADAPRKVRERNERNNCRAARDAVKVAIPAIPAAPGVPGGPPAPDTAAPAAPRLASTQPASPSGATTRPLLLGAAEAGSTVRVFSGLACTGEPVAVGSAGAVGTFAIEVPVAPNAATALRAVAQDAAGNASPCSLEALTFVHDGIPPAEPALASTAPASPSADGVPLVSGTAEPGATVELFAGPCTGAPAATVAASGAGAFSSPVAVPADASTALHARARDAAGNPSSCSAPLAYVEDSTAPAAPAISSSDPASPGRDATPTLSGTAEPGSSLALHGQAECAGDPVGQAAAGGGAFSLEAPAAANAARTFSARAVDAAGNASGCSAGLLYVHDGIAPAPPGLVFSPASPNNDRTPQVAGSAEPQSTVAVYRGAACDGAPEASGIAGADIQLLTVPANATTTFSARATDAAGNVSACGPPATYRHDDIAPGTPTPLTTTPASPSPVGTPQVNGSGAAAGVRIDLFVGTVCNGTPAASVTATGASWSAAVDVPTDTTSQIRARATDAAGNASGCSSPLAYREDSLTPEPPTIAAQPASPSPDQTPTLSGAAEPGATVLVFTGSACPDGAPAHTTQADAGGAWGLTVGVTANAPTTFRALARDAAQNASGCSSPLEYVHDNVAPAAPQLTSTTPASPSTENRPFFTGTAPPDAVSVDVMLNCFLSPIATGTPAQLAAGTLRPALPVPNGALLYYARSRDAAGNTGSCGSPILYHEQTPAAVIAEVEPNGTAAEAGARALRITEDHLITGALDAADAFRLGTVGQPVMRFETFSGAGGTRDCAGIDTGLQLRVNGVVAASDADSGIGACSAITRYLDSTTFPAAVDAVVTGAGGGAYTLEARTLRSEGEEVEPNNTTGQARFVFGSDNYVTGVLNGSADADFFAVFVPGGFSVRVEAISRPGFLPACENTSNAVSVSLHGPAAGLPVTSTGAHGGISPNTCALLDGTGAAPQVPAAHAIAGGGTFFIGVTTAGAGQQPYLLSWTVRQP